MTAQVRSLRPYEPDPALKARLDKASNVEAEAAILGAMMIDNRIVPVIAELVEPQDFYEPVHGSIFARILSVVDANKTATPVTLHTMFDDDATLRDLGGAGAYLASLTEQPAALIVAPDFARMVADLAKRREFIVQLDMLTTQATDFALTNEDIVEGLDAGMSAILERRTTTSSHTIAQAFDIALGQIDDEAAGRTPRGVASKFLPDFTEIAGEMRPGEVVVVGARPGMGKTAFALSMSLGAAANGHGVLYVSLEMRVGALTKRMIADLTFAQGHSATFEQIKRGELSGFDWDRVRAARKRVDAWPLEITDPASLKVTSLGMMVRRYQRRMAARGAKLEMVVIDYLGLMKAGQRGTAYETTTEISKTLREVAKECDVAIMVLAQLNREVEKRDDKRPQTSDLRDSGQIEQDADCIAFLYREQFYLEQAEPSVNSATRAAWEEKMAAARDRLEIYTVKRRDGRIGKRHCFFFGEHQAVRGSRFYQEQAYQESMR